MNTKGTKFLAVLAVLAMAFAAFAVIAPTETDDADIAGDPTYYSPGSEVLDTKAFTGAVENVGAGKYYVSNATPATITSTAAAVDADNHVIIFAGVTGTAYDFVITAGSYVDFATVTVGAENHLSYAGITMAFVTATAVTINVGTNGNLSIQGTFALADGDKLVIPEGKTITIADNTNVALAAGATSASVVVKGTLTIQNTKTLDIADNINLTVNGTINGTGTLDLNGGKLTQGTGVDLSGVTITGNIDGEIRDKREFSSQTITGDTSYSSSYTYPATQSITIAGTWTLLNGADLTIKGELIINEGSKIIIEPGAKLTIDNNAKVYVYGSIVTEVTSSELADGKLLIKSGYVYVYGALKDNGDVILDGSGSVLKANLIAEDGGSINVTKTGYLESDANSYVEVNSFSEFLIQGLMSVAEITNKGTVTLNSDAYGVGTTTITQASSSAVVDIQKYITAYKPGAEALVPKTLTITYTNTSTNSVTIVGTTGENDHAVLFKNLKVSGTSPMSVAGEMTMASVYIGTGAETPDAAASVSITLAGTFATTKTIRVAAGDVLKTSSKISITNSNNLDVYGTLTAMSSADAKLTNSDTVNVYDAGVIDNYADLTNTINAAKIVISSTDYRYLTIDAALTQMYDSSDIEEVTALGTTTLTANNKIAKDDVLVVSGTLNIGKNAGDDITLTAESESEIRGSGTINVNGTLFAYDQTNVKTSAAVTIVSDVKITEVDDKGREVRDGWAKWTNVITALAGASPGEIIKITKSADAGYVTIGVDLTIPAGVTLYVPEDRASLFLNDGVTLTINGILITEEDVYAESMFAVKATNISGEQASSAIVVNGMMFMPDSYTATYAEDVDADPSALSDGAPIAGAYYSTDEYAVISTLALAVDVVEEIVTPITINGAVTAGDIVFTGSEECNTILIGSKTANIDTALTINSLTLSSAKLGNDVNTTGVITGVVGDSVGTLTLDKMAGRYIITDASSKLTLAGSNITGKVEVSTGTVIAAADIHAAEINVASGATFDVSNTTGAIAKMRVDGTVNIANGKTLNVTSATVYGTVAAAAATSTVTAGKFSVGTLSVGMTPYTITAANATVSGSLAITTAAFVLNGSTIDATAQETLDAMNATTFHVEGVEWFTAYAVAADKTITVSTVKVDNAVLLGWASSSTATEADISSVDPITIGAKANLYAVLQYEIYNVYILTDNGIKSVAIDGKEMVHVGNNLFAAYDDIGDNPSELGSYLKAGTHTVSYTTYSGYTGLVNLYTADNTILKDLKFVLSGVDEANTNITLQLYGTEQSITPEPEPVVESEWTVTTILLLILVILIAIMAVIVALRLNRS